MWGFLFVCFLRGQATVEKVKKIMVLVLFVVVLLGFFNKGKQNRNVQPHFPKGPWPFSYGKHE